MLFKAAALGSVLEETHTGLCVWEVRLGERFRPLEGEHRPDMTSNEVSLLSEFCLGFDLLHKCPYASANCLGVSALV